MKKEEYALFIGIALLVAGIGVVASPYYKGTATSFTRNVVEKSSVKYGLLYTLQRSVGKKVDTAGGHYYALVLNSDFIKAVTPPVVGVNGKTYPVTGEVVYADDTFLKTGNGYIFLKLTTTGGTAELVARATLEGSLVNVQPLYGVLKTGKKTLYLVSIPGSGFSFKAYDSVNVDISPFFAGDKPRDPVTGAPMPLS